MIEVGLAPRCLFLDPSSLSQTLLFFPAAAECPSSRRSHLQPPSTTGQVQGYTFSPAQEAQAMLLAARGTNLLF